MESKFMMLSLLNLYLKYVEVKNGKKAAPVNGRSNVTKRLQTHKSMDKDSQASNAAIQPSTSKSAKEQNEVTQCVEVQVSQQNVKMAINNSRPVGRTIKNSMPVKVNTVKRSRERKNEDSNRKPRIRRWAIRPINQDRAITGYHRKFFSNIKNMTQEQFFVHTRMSKPIFDWLLSFTRSSLNKKRQRVLAQERLAITLNYLAYGTPLQSIAWKHKLGKSTIREVVLSTCSVLWSLLSPIYVSEPTTSQYGDIAEDFKSKWGIPNCVGAIDGKHVSTKIRVKKKATLNNENCSNMVLMGVCDAKYKFTAVSVENFDNQNDEGIFQFSAFGSAMITDNLPLPASKPLFPSSSPFPHYFIGTTSLPLRKNIMRPYVGANLNTEESIFNYKISHACSVTENSFGILTARWRVLLTTIEFLPESCKTILLACVALHNFIMTNDEEQLYCPDDFVDRVGDDGNTIPGEWRNELTNNEDEPLRSMTTSVRRSCYEANNLRDCLANFFANESITYEIEIL